MAEQLIAAGADVDAKNKVCTLHLLYVLGDWAWARQLYVLPAQNGKSPMEVEMAPALKQALAVSVCCVCAKFIVLFVLCSESTSLGPR